MIGLPGEAPAHAFACSRAGCSEAANWALRWRNPKIHSADRFKHWLACDAHLDYLRDFLTSRSFPVEIVPIAELTEQAEQAEQA
ncbi:MAG: hypothetical protein ACNYNX_09465 [Leucobacter sp.]